MQAETEGVTSRLFVLTAALTALYLILNFPLSSGDPLGLIDSGKEAIYGLAAPRTKPVGFVVSGRKKEDDSVRKSQWRLRHGRGE